MSFSQIPEAKCFNMSQWRKEEVGMPNFMFLKMSIFMSQLGHHHLSQVLWHGCYHGQAKVPYVLHAQPDWEGLSHECVLMDWGYLINPKQAVKLGLLLMLQPFLVHLYYAFPGSRHAEQFCHIHLCFWETPTGVRPERAVAKMSVPSCFRLIHKF